MATHTTTTTAAIYCRISKDDGTALGVARQEEDCRAFCERRGWPVAEVIVDNDVSAFSGKRRPGYAKLMEGIEAGHYGALVVWHPDRLHRSPLELEHFIDVVERHHLAVATCTAGDLDLSTPDGRLTARIVGSVARKESEDKSRRLRRKMDANAAEGRPHGGKAFGYEKDGVTINEVEAAALRQAVADIIAGESLAGIANRWNEAGLKPQRAALWNVTTVKSVLTNPRHAGFRVHRKEVVGKGAWPAVIDEASHRRVVAILSDPARAKKMPPRRHALTTIIRCDECGQPLRKAMSHGILIYGCSKIPGSSNCGALTVGLHLVEPRILKALFEVVDSPELMAALSREVDGMAEGAAQAAELEEITAQLNELAEAYAAKLITMPEWLTARKALEARQEDATATLSRATRSHVLTGYAGRTGALEAAWSSLTVDTQRAIMGAVFAEVRIKRSRFRGGKFDEDRIVFVPAFDV